MENRSSTRARLPQLVQSFSFPANPSKNCLSLTPTIFLTNCSYLQSCSYPQAQAADNHVVVVVGSFDYRLAPEHRLPAAQEDGARALAWLARGPAGDDPWLAAAGADLSRVFVAGDSAGGNIAHHAVVAKSGELAGALRGCVLLMPAMAGEARTPSESECPPESFLRADLADRYLRLALPEGAGRDHPAINLEAPPLDAVAVPPVLVVAAGRVLLRDRNRHYAERMREWGKEVEYAEIEGEQHVFFLLDAWSENADEVVWIVRKFVVDHME